MTLSRMSLVSILAAICTPALAMQDVESASDAAETETENGAPNPDDSADLLNSQQQLKQTFTLERRMDGELIETKKQTVTLSPGVPYRPTEAGETVLEQVRAAFDQEALSRIEAFEEAKLDFTVADADRNDLMTVDEFTALVATWRGAGVREPVLASDAEDSRDRQYTDILEPIVAEVDPAQERAYARAKFAYISGASPTISRQDYIREYLLDFDAMDENNDTVLQGDELLRFRAANRGESIRM